MDDYVSTDGRRCEARAFLELDHELPRALGGDSTARNLRVLCRAHNQLAAEQAFGRETIERARHFGRTKSDFRRLHVALTGLGFGSAQAREALAEVERSYPNGPPSLEQALREAILAATRCGETRRVA